MKYIHAKNRLIEADKELNKTRMAVYTRGKAKPLTEKDHQEYKDLCMVQHQIQALLRTLEMMSDI